MGVTTHPRLSVEETGGLATQAGAGHLFLVGAEILPRPAGVQGLRSSGS